MEIQKQTSAMFTGHRIIGTGKAEGLRQRVRESIIGLYQLGYRQFYCGMAKGFDMLAAEVLLSLKQLCPRLQLIAIVPYRAQSERFSPEDKRRYNRILAAANQVKVLSEIYYERCFLDRNDYMLNHSSLVVAYFDGFKIGGTAYTCRKALQKRLTIDNLYI